MIDQKHEINDQSEGGMTTFLLFVWDFLKVVVIALAIIVPIRYFIFQPYIISGSSMEPNYSNGQYLIIDRLTYHFRQPQRGEVVVLKYPKDPKQDFIKRIIGLPGDKIEIDNGRVKIYNEGNPQGVTLPEDYLPNQGLSFPHNTTIVGGKKTVTLKSGEYFAMGDNRLASSDSRDWGILPESNLVGKAFIRVLPLTQFEVFKRPAYSF